MGRTIGFPTANIIYPLDKVEIPFGAYSVDVVVKGTIYKGVLNYGIKPTVSNIDKVPVAEVHILDFDEDIYNKKIRILINSKIRDEIKFDSIESLAEQIKKDVYICLKS